MRHWARLLTVHPRFCAVVVLLLTCIAAAGIPLIGFDIRPNATITSDNEPSRDLARLKETFGPDDNDVVVIVRGEDLLSRQSLEALRTMRDQIRDLNDIEHVASIFDVRKRGSKVAPMIPSIASDGFDSEQLAADLLKHPIAANQLIADEGNMLIMWARIQGGSLSVSSISSVIDPAYSYARQYEEKTGNKVLLAGHTAVRADVLVMLRKAMFISCTAAGIICFVVSMVLFRSIVPVLVAVLPPAIGSAWTFGLMGLCGEPVGGLCTALPNLMFAIGLTDSVHLLLDGQRHLRAGRSQPHAVYGMLVRIGPACFLTSLTTMIGFGSLMLSRTESVQTFGMWAAIGTSLVVLADLILLPLFLHWIPSKHLMQKHTEHDGFARGINWLISPTLKKAGLTTVCAAITCVLLCIPAFSQSPDIVWTETIPDDAPATAAMRLADEKMDGALVAYVIVDWPESLEFPDAKIVKATSAVQSILRDEKGFGADFSIVNVLASTPGRRLSDRYRTFCRAPDQVQQALVNPEKRCLTITSRVPNDGAAALNGRVESLQSKIDTLRSEYRDFGFTITGTVVAASKNMHEIILDLARSLAIAAFLVFIVFAITFRCLKIGLLSVIPNAFPLLVAAAALSMLGYPLQITTALTFSLCLGLAVDDTMHVLIRFREIRRRGSDATTAVRRTIRHVGPALIVTTAILFAGFGSMMTSPLPGVRMFAALCSLTLVTALVGDLLILPAMLVFASTDRDE